MLLFSLSYTADPQLVGKGLKMKISEIIKDRNCGYLRINSSATFSAPIEKIMESFGLFPFPKELKKINYQQAVNVIASILWKDLAYSCEMIKEETAYERADFLVSQFYEENTLLN
ncbi:hypothetical protein [Geomonas sp. Red276]